MSVLSELLSSLKALLGIAFLCESLAFKELLKYLNANQISCLIAFVVTL